MDLSIFIKYYLDKDSDYQLSIDKIFLIKVQALVGHPEGGHLVEGHFHFLPKVKPKVECQW